MLANIENFFELKGQIDIKKFKKLLKKKVECRGFSVEFIAKKMGKELKDTKSVFSFLETFKIAYDMGAKNAGLDYFIWCDNVEKFFNYHTKALLEFAKNEAFECGGEATLSSFCEVCLGGKKDYLGDFVMGDGYELKEALVFGILNDIAYKMFENISKSEFLECFCE